MKIQDILTRFKSVKQERDGWLALCPSHEDKNPSLSISQGNDGRILLNCFAGCKILSILESVGLEMSDLFNDTPKTHLKHTQSVPGASIKQSVKHSDSGCTLSDYAKAKNLPVDFLRELGVQESRFKGIPQLVIPYHDEDGIQTAVRYRTSIDGKNKFKWRSGDKVCLYGLERLNGYEKPTIFLVEGESDCQTLWFHGIQALGISGANNWDDERDSPKFEKFKNIYVIIETDKQGKPDAGGKTVLKWLSKSSIKPKVWIAKLPTNDVSELHVDNPDNFKARFKACLKEAIPFLRYENQRLENISVEMVKTPENQVTPENKEPTEWDKARELFPRLPFPWEVLPEEIAESLKQLARSHATSPLSLPGAAMSIFASVLGSTVNVSPKESWREPLIFWFADIRPSGSGKTPAARALCNVLYQAQNEAEKDYKQRLEDELLKKPRDRRPVPRARGYFITDLTLEGLRCDISGHGGTACVMDELSSFLSAQNQYKSKGGNDREAWLALYDGNPARFLRAKESLMINGARLNLFGGVQPRIWKDIFGGADGLYLDDGTVYRFLPTFEGESSHLLTKESWSDENRQAWECALTHAMEWADEIIVDKNWKSKNICLSEDAQDYFLNWRNTLEGHKAVLSDQLKGFLPKTTGSAIRLSGVLYCMDCFTVGTYPMANLNLADIQKGINAAMFYMGQIVDATQALCSNKQIVPFEITDQVKHLAKTLESLRNEVDNGHLAVGYIQERFNEELKPEQKIKSPHAMGSLLRKSNMTIPEGHFRANKRIKVKCLLWDKKTDSFLKQVHKVLFVHNTINHAGLEARTLKNQSPQSPQNITEGKKTEDIEDIEKPKSSPVSFRATNDVDNEDIEDIVSKENKKTELIPVEKWVNKSLPDDVEATRTRDAILI